MNTVLYVSQSMESIELSAPEQEIDLYCPPSRFFGSQVFNRLTPALYVAFESYWEQKDRQNAEQGLRLLDEQKKLAANRKKLLAAPADTPADRLAKAEEDYERYHAALLHSQGEHQQVHAKLQRAGAKLSILREWAALHFSEAELDPLRKSPPALEQVFRQPIWSGRLPWKNTTEDESHDRDGA